MIIEKGTISDITELERLYRDSVDYLNGHTNYPGWQKGIYPVRQTAVKGIEEGSLFVVRDAGRIVGTVILSHVPEPAYAQVNWGIETENQDVLVIYTFAVHPLYQNKGVGKRVMDFIIRYGKEQGMKAIRLDVYEENTPAIHLYRKYGFRYIDTVDLGYGKYGLYHFELYQKIL